MNQPSLRVGKETITFQFSHDRVRVLKAYRVMRRQEYLRQSLSRETAKKLILDLLFCYVTNWEFEDGEVFNPPRHKAIKVMRLPKGDL